MVAAAASEGPAKAQLNSGRRVSKPMMEKKRRARINECLDELKILMENYYTNYIRKRKLEKADILEMTVKHLRNLQRAQQGHFVDAGCAEYPAGFKSCLGGANHLLLRAEQPGGFLRLSVRKYPPGRPGTSATTVSSTADSTVPARLPFAVATPRAEPGSDSRSVAPEDIAGRRVAEPRLPQALRDLKDCGSVPPHGYWRPWQKM